MIQQPNTMLATKNTGRKMDGLVYQCKKQKMKIQNKLPFCELAHSSNNLKAMASGEPNEVHKRVMRTLSHVVGSNGWA